MMKNDKRERSFVVGLEEGFSKLQYHSSSFNNHGGKSSSRKRKFPPLTSIDDNGSVPRGTVKSSSQMNYLLPTDIMPTVV